MNYSMYGGVQYTPLENVKYFASTFRERNWLPVAVGTITAVWISLLLVNVMQHMPADHGAPTVRPKSGSQQISIQPTSSKSNGPIVVVQSSGNVAMTNGSVATPRAAFANKQTLPDNNVAAAAASAPSTAANVGDSVVGGMGGDPTSAAVTAPTDPTTTATNPTVTVTPAPTPVTSTVPITVNTTPTSPSVSGGTQLPVPTVSPNLSGSTTSTAPNNPL